MPSTDHDVHVLKGLIKTTLDSQRGLNQMLTSGRIDNGAFAGEPMMDDEEDQFGKTEPDDDDGLRIEEV